MSRTGRNAGRSRKGGTGADPDTFIEQCPFCEYSGPKLAVYHHIEDEHPEIDPDDVFERPDEFDDA